VQLVRDLDARLKKMNAELPGDRTAPVAASLDSRLRLLLDAKDGKPVEALGDVAAELRELEDDVDIFLEGGDPYAKKKQGHQRRAVMLDKTAVPYRVYIPKSVDLAKKPPLVVALHGTGASENFWMEGTKLVELAEAKGFVVVAPRNTGGATAHLQNGAVLGRVIEDLPIGAIWLMGHSMGGQQALELGAASPEQFAGVITFAPTGRVDLSKLKGSDVYIACGARDGLVEGVRAMVKRADGQKGLTYEERPDLEHLTIVWECLNAATDRIR
jgi:pimeloyl-ACP methyl ester carboxylesterase